MGYTHYWSGKPVLSQGVIEDIGKIIEESGVKIGDGLGQGMPLLSLDAVEFNGWEADDEHYETFTLGDGSWNFCKTARLPYDVVVCAALIRVREASPDFVIESDGRWDDADEWVPARELYARALFRETILTGLDK